MSISREDERWENEEREDRLLEEISQLKRELAEARAALREFAGIWGYCECVWIDADGYLDCDAILDAKEKHAAALKAAREGEP